MWVLCPHTGCHYRPGLYLDPWIIFGGHWNGLDWITISVSLKKFGEVRSITEYIHLGPGKSNNGPHGPYYQVSFLWILRSCTALHSRQSERLDLYKHYAGKLVEVRYIESCRIAAHMCFQSGHAYRCFCSPDVLTETREKLARAGSSTSYDRRCLHLTDEEVARKVKAGEKHIVRFNVSDNFFFFSGLLWISF